MLALGDAQVLARRIGPRTTAHYDRGRGNLDRPRRPLAHCIHVAGV